MPTPSENRTKCVLEGGSANRMRLRCNQLDEHFSFQNSELAVCSLPAIKIKNQRGLDEIWAIVTEERVSSQDSLHELVQFAQCPLEW
jgi:hypothetical protein